MNDYLKRRLEKASRRQSKAAPKQDFQIRDSSMALWWLRVQQLEDGIVVFHQKVSYQLLITKSREVFLRPATPTYHHRGCWQAYRWSLIVARQYRGFCAAMYGYYVRVIFQNTLTDLTRAWVTPQGWHPSPRYIDWQHYACACFYRRSWIVPLCSSGSASIIKASMRTERSNAGTYPNMRNGITQAPMNWWRTK